MKYETKTYTKHHAYTSYSHLDEWEEKGIEDSCYDNIPDDVEGVEVFNDRDGFIPPISEEWEHSKKTDWYAHVPTGIKVKLEVKATPDYHKVGGHGSCTTTLTVKIPLPDGRGMNPNSHHNKKK